MHFHAPQVLLYTSEEKKILPIAIYFSDGDKKHRVVSALDNLPNTWLLAKMHANCADIQLYVFIYHLGLGHLCSEPFVVGIHNVFAIHDKDHFMSKMMRPHFKNLIGINHLATISLTSKSAPLTD